jgi:predicted alpha/beta superfamily hydrolase
MTMNDIGLASLLFTLAGASYPVFSQPDPETLIHLESPKIHSTILNEERLIRIYLPDDYFGSSRAFPVLYLLDGDKDSFLRAIGFLRLLTETNRVPEMMLVAIPNTDRSRDMLPSKTVYHLSGGGADAFRKFLTGELVPFVNSRYRTTAYKALIGFSNSGLFTVYTLLTEPDSFDAYIACSPSIAWYPERFFHAAEALMAERRSLDKSFIVVRGEKEGIPHYGDRYYYDMDSVDRLVEMMKSRAPNDFTCKMKTIDGEGHVPPTSIYEGLFLLFSKWTPVPEPEIVPTGGVFPKGGSIQIELKGGKDSIHYTVDGSEPNKDSPIYTQRIIIDHPATVKARAFRANLGESDTVSADYGNASISPAGMKPDGLSPGLTYEYYEDYLLEHRLPDFDSIEPLKTGIAQTISSDMKEMEDCFAIRFDGYINIAEAGTYRFYLNANNGTRLSIGKHLVIDKQRGFSFEEKSFQVVLGSGNYPLALLYTAPPFLGLNGLRLKVLLEGPGIEKEEIPPELLFH